MSLSSLLLAVWFILYGLNALNLVAVSTIVLGLVALILGVALLIESWHPVTLFKR